jgi:hypothetical protein
MLAVTRWSQKVRLQLAGRMDKNSPGHYRVEGSQGKNTACRQFRQGVFAKEPRKLGRIPARVRRPSADFLDDRELIGKVPSIDQIIIKSFTTLLSGGNMKFYFFVFGNL